MSDDSPAPTTTSEQPSPSGASPEGAPDAASARPEGAGNGAGGAGEGPAQPESVQVSPGVYKRLTTGLAGFATAIVACLLLVGVIYLITPRANKELLPTIDYGSQEWALAHNGPYQAWGPQGLPAGWRATSARLTGLGEKGGPVQWHLGFIAPSGQYAALEESNEKAAEYVPRMTNSKAATGTRAVSGITWDTYFRRDKKANSLARTLPDGVSVVVTGTAGYDELAVLAAALKPLDKTGTSVVTPAPTQRS
ncbi:DUF4245 domain-containing protein [Actinomadura harenae]|uniref:DUF4245 domain-containing protein n=1 Tax=Actinomadura harenae TaxID=2483351 RepID=A0A3M2M6I9_9ACTN|nr:DUF4245 domain-containing protein [Actinomadura harenae]RMI44473.1 DUF4245 domain-containing protein [Actinomadura harenae]